MKNHDETAPGNDPGTTPESARPTDTTDTTTGTTDTIDDVFDNTTDTIYRDRSLLDPNRIVGTDRIVGRDDQARLLATLLKPLLNNDTPSNILCYGSSGTGKSLLTNHVLTRIQTRLGDDTRLAVLDVNCQWIKTNYQAVQKLADKAEALPHVNDDINVSGASTDEGLETTLAHINANYDACVIVLDEIDLLTGSSTAPIDDDPGYSKLLYQLSRVEGLTGMDSLATIALTNAPDFTNRLDSRVQSSFSPRNVEFPDYDANELTGILNKRRDAFIDDVVDDGVIQLAAAYSAQDYGDAREAIVLLRAAADIADESDAARITEAHVNDAHSRAATDRVLNVAEGFSVNKQLVLWSAAAVIEHATADIDVVATPVLKRVYSVVVELADHGYTRKSDPTISRYLTEFETNELIQRSTLRSRGPTTGTFKEYSLNRDAADICQAIEASTDALEHVLDEIELLQLRIDQAISDFYDKSATHD